MPTGSTGVPTPDDYDWARGESGDVKLPPSLSKLARQYEALNQQDYLSRHRDVIVPQSGESNDPLTVNQRLEVLALAEAIARRARSFRGVEIHDAVRAGASWSGVATAVGGSVAEVQERYQRWADGQHALHRRFDGKVGLDEREYAEALARLATPEAER